MRNKTKKALGIANWNTLAEIDPLWTILSDPQKRYGKWDQSEFFGTGEREAERVLSMCNAHGINISYGRLLDFGCGVGRMTRAFSRHFQSCVGVDISEKMICLARDYNSAYLRCQFVLNETDVLPFPPKSFDFVFTLLVLQHLPSSCMILQCIAEFLRVARDQAIIVFELTTQVPFRNRFQLRRRLWSLLAHLGISHRWLFEKLGLAPIRMNTISRMEIEEFLNRHGARLLAVESYDPNDDIFRGCYYFVAKQPPPSE